LFLEEGWTIFVTNKQGLDYHLDRFVYLIFKRMAEKVLAEDWSDYDDRKKRGGSDRINFSCEESWEREYLVQKIRKTYPQYSEERIKDAIQKCCETTPAPRPRPGFVECVMRRLRN
jgi:hypothetical protein